MMALIVIAFVILLLLVPSGYALYLIIRDPQKYNSEAGRKVDDEQAAILKEMLEEKRAKKAAKGQ